MESGMTGTAPGPAEMPQAAETPTLSVWQRAIAVFVRTPQAWSGLETRSQWWFPMIIMMVVGAIFALALFDRALMPMISETWEQQVSEGRMTAQQVDKMEDMMRGPVGKAFTVGQQVIVWPIILLLSALVVWFGVGFVLGTRFRYRLALEVVAWASLVSIPGQILAGVLAWSRETMKGLHTGFGILVPESDPPTKIQLALGFFLDSIGPLSIWYLAVVIIGAAALSGAKRRSVAWALGGLYLALMVFFAAMAAMFSRG